MSNTVFGAWGTGRKRWLLFLARAAIIWERLWGCFWRAFLLVGLFFSVVLLDPLPRLPGALHLAVLLAFAAAFAFLVRAGARDFAWPLASDARRRIEKDSGLRHRPLTALRDRQASDQGRRHDPVSRALWRAHLKRVLTATGRLRVAAPVGGLAGKDPFAIRAAVLLVFVIALVAGRGDAAARMERALLPYSGPGGGGPVTVRIWITPPAYTGLPPLFLTASRQGDGGEQRIAARPPIRVAAGSLLLAQTGGASALPRLNLGGRLVSFSPIGDDRSGDAYRARTVIGAIGRNGRNRVSTISVEAGRRTLAQWPIRVVADRPPEAAFVATPKPVGRSSLRFDYRARDDYGVTSITAIIKRANAGPDAASEPELRLSLPLPPRSPVVPGGQDETAPATKPDAWPGVSLRTRSVRDLSAHPWAGLPVTIALEVRDAAGQTATSDPVGIVLPERTFKNPVARAIIVERKKLARAGGGDRARVAMALGVIAAAPQRFNNDSVVSVVLAVARARLLYDQNEKSIRTTRALLWDTALRIEDGDIGAAERELARAEKDMMKALGDGGKGRALEEKIDALGRALDRYFEALARDMARRGVPPGVIGPGAGIIMNEDLKRILDQARQMARAGALEGLRGIMDTLRRLLDTIRSAARPGSGTGDLAKIIRLMDSLNRLTEDQKTLLDETFRRVEKARTEGDTIMDRAEEEREAARQEALRRRLGKIMPGLDVIMGKIPRDFGRAEGAMRAAARALAQGGKGGGGEAVESQTRALESLRRAVAEVTGDMARRIGGRIGVGAAGVMMPGRRGRDPFGRMPGGGMAGNKVKIPSRIDTREARRILRELRNRSGQRLRPRRERDYIERLLKQF